MALLPLQHRMLPTSLSSLNLLNCQFNKFQSPAGLTELNSAVLEFKMCEHPSEVIYFDKEADIMFN